MASVCTDSVLLFKRVSIDTTSPHFLAAAITNVAVSGTCCSVAVAVVPRSKGDAHALRVTVSIQDGASCLYGGEKGNVFKNASL